MSAAQLRDLIVCPWEQPGTVSVVCGASVATHQLDQTKPSEYTKLGFPPCSIAYGLGLVAAGGQVGELALRSAAEGSEWSYQNMPPPQSASINNAIWIHPSPQPSSSGRPRVLVSNNARVINVYEVAGATGDLERAKRRRRRDRRPGEEDEDEGEQMEESVQASSPCELERVEGCDVFLSTQVNHCSVSPDGRRMVAVGDTNEVFLFDVASGSGTYTLTHVFAGSNGASFSTDWSPSGHQFAVASEDGIVSIFDVRSLPPSIHSSPFSPHARDAPRRVAEIHSLQTGVPRNPGAVRKVKFSPSEGGGVPLLGFTEHRSLFHVMDARTFDNIQTMDIPATYSDSLPASASGSADFPSPASLGTHNDLPLERRPPRWAYYRPLDTSPPGAEEGVAPSRAAGLLDGMMRFHAREQVARQRASATGEGPTSAARSGLVERVEVLIERAQAAGGPARASMRTGGGAWGIATGALNTGGGLRWLMGAEEGDERDILGFDWDEWGEGGVVALGHGVVEFKVDAKGSRCVGSWEPR